MVFGSCVDRGDNHLAPDVEDEGFNGALLVVKNGHDVVARLGDDDLPGARKFLLKSLMRDSEEALLKLLQSEVADVCSLTI